jgi:hypothetical protein
MPFTVRLKRRGGGFLVEIMEGGLVFYFFKRD